MNIEDRAAGVMLHITSLPGPHGSGDFGPDAYRFVDWLASAGQRLWQCPAHVGDVRSVQVRVDTHLALMFSIQCSNSHVRCSCKSSRLRPET